MKTKRIAHVAGWAVLAFALVVLGIPLAAHVVHLGMAIIKLVIEAGIAGALIALSVWLVRM